MEHVLVTNDDGPGTAGLRAAVRAAAAAGLRVAAVVPAGDASATGTALGAFTDTWFSAVPAPSAPAAEQSYTMDAHPAAIVTFAALGAFGARPDLVVAGVNHGANSGVGVLHSATVGAASTAALHGIPALALSADGPSPDRDWAACERAAHAVIGACAELWGATAAPRWPPGVLNVNLPAVPPADPGDVVWCEPAHTSVTEGHLERRTGPGRPVGLRLVFRATGRTLPAGTDTGALQRGRVPLCWLPGATAPSDPFRRPGTPGAHGPDQAQRTALLEAVRRRWPRPGPVPAAPAGRMPAPPPADPTKETPTC